jgi:hypothetical protein
MINPTATGDLMSMTFNISIHKIKNISPFPNILSYLREHPHITYFLSLSRFSSQLSLSFSLSLSLRSAPETAISAPTGHEFQLCQLANGRVDGAAVAQYKVGPQRPQIQVLVKNLGKRMPESVVREELESMNIQVQGVIQLRSGRRDQDPAKDRPPPLTS